MSAVLRREEGLHHSTKAGKFGARVLQGGQRMVWVVVVAMASMLQIRDPSSTGKLGRLGRSLTFALKSYEHPRLILQAGEMQVLAASQNKTHVLHVLFYLLY